MRFVFVLIFILQFSFHSLAYEESQSSDNGKYVNASVDPNVDPCANFYLFACGAWLKKNPIPGGRFSHDRFDEVRQNNQELLRNILQKASQNMNQRNVLDQKIGDYYASCMDEKKIEARGLSAIQRELDQISGMRSVNDLAKLTALFHTMNVRVLFQLRPISETGDGSFMVGELRQSGIGLPDRDYYTGDDRKSLSLRESYVNHVGKMFEISGMNSEVAMKGAKVVLEIESALASKSLTIYNLQNPDRVIHKLTLEEIQNLAPLFSWFDYLNGIKAPEFKSVIVTPPEFLKEMDNLLRSRTIEDWRFYFQWHLLRSLAPYLSVEFQNERAQFYELRLNGSIETKPRWNQCLDFTEFALGDALGKKFIDETLTENSRERLIFMIEALKKAIGKKLVEISWFSEESRKEAILKLSAIEGKIGYPETMLRYENLQITGDNWITNVISAQQFLFQQQLKRIGKPVNRREWRISPSSTNAFYNPTLNEIVFTAGILQPPFFDEHADDATNFGAIGAVIAHELTHAFDENGRNFDSKGNPRDWWTESDQKEFASRATCFVEQYGQYRAGGLYNMNGHLTLSENIADHGGLRFAYEAYRDAINRTDFDRSDEQRFFLSWAQIWCENQTDEWTRKRVIDDIHSLGWYRTNGVVGALPEFREAFGCSEDANMVQKNPCRLW